MNLFASIISLSLTGCLETKIRDTFVDRTAPDAPASATWVKTDDQNFTSTITTETTLKATWVPSVSTDSVSQKIQIYSDANCSVASGAPILLASTATNTYSFPVPSDGTFSFQIFSADRRGNRSESNCASGMTVDTTAPSIAITVPANNVYINLSNDSSNYQVSGTCSEEGRTVTIKKGTGGSATAIGSALCTGGTFNTNVSSLVTNAVDATALSETTHSITATIEDLAANSTTSSAVSVTRDVTAPTNAATLVWRNSLDQLIAGTRYHQAAIKAAWTRSSSTDVASQSIQFYSGASCSVAIGSLLNLSAPATTQSFAGADGQIYSFKVTTTDVAGNTSTTACSGSMEIDTTPPTVSITSAASWINDGNKAAYHVTGECGDAGIATSGGSVSLSVTLNDGITTKTITPTCTIASGASSGTYSATFDTTAATALIDGSSHITVTASVTDSVNNTASATQGSVSRDTAFPALTLTSASIPTWINAATVSAFPVTGTCSDATSGLDGKTITVTMTSGTGAGAVTATGTAICSGGSFTTNVNASAFADTATANISITAAVEDVAGNATTTAAITRKKDTVLPVLAITSPVTGGYVNATASVPITFTLVEQNTIDSQPVTFKQNGVEVNPSLSVSSGTVNANVSNQRMFTQNINTSGLSDGTTVSVSVAYIDPAGNAATTASASYTIDTGAPTITSFALNGGNSATMNNNVSVSLVASNDLSPVTHYCLKNKVAGSATVPTAPTVQDACWTLISSATTTVSVTGFYQVGFLQDSYDVYAWVKNGAGLISILTGGVGELNKDQFTVNYNPGSPPVISALQVSNLDSPSNPVADSEMQFNGSSQIYLKWLAGDVDNNLGSNPIDIYYTTDNSTYQKLTESPLTNGVNGSCTLTGGFSGCAVIPSPVASGYFKIRIEAKDTNQTSVFYGSVPLNSTNFKVIAGNTETGFGGSAKTAVFNMLGSGAQLSYVSSHRLAVSTDGKYFYLDPTYGLVWINPANGNLVRFIETNFNSPTSDSLEGSDVATAKLKDPLGIAMDYSDRLLIYDHDRIRRVDLSTMKISTIIGGGNVFLHNYNTTVTDPRSVKLYSPSLWNFSLTMTPLPNGELLFTSQDSGYSNNYDWKYKPNDTIEPIHYVDSDNKGLGDDPELSWDFLRTVIVGSPPISRTLLTRRIGFGIAYDPNQLESFTANVFLKGFLYENVSDTFPQYARINYNSGNASLSYNSITPVNLGDLNYKSITTGLDGNIYAVRRGRARLERYDYASNTLSSVVGTGFTPNYPCADNTPVSQCAVDIDSFFVSRSGTVYFMDQGALRTINDNKVITLFGQFASHGTGSALTALNARFGRITDLKLDRSSSGFNRTVVWDTFAKTFREVIKNGNVSDLTSTAFSWAGPYRFEMDPANGDIFYTNDSFIYRYSKQGGLSSIVGGNIDGANLFYQPDTDGKGGNQVRLSHYPRSLIGFIDGEIYQETYFWNNFDFACMVKKFSSSQPYTQSHFLGDMTCNGTWVEGLATDRTGASIGLDVSRVEKFGTTLLFGRKGTQKIYTKDAQNQLQLFATVGRDIYSFTHSASSVSGEPNIYYCQGGNAIYQFNRGSATSGNEVTYPLPQGINCLIDSTIHYVENGGTKSIIFAFGQNGLYGVGEYILP